MSGLCDAWPTDLGCCTDLPDDIPDGVVERSALIASQLLWMLSGRQFGPTCPITIRPCLARCPDVTDNGPVLAPYIDRGKWYNACGCGPSCSCGSLCEVRLPDTVYDIEAVTVDGIPLDDDAYRVDDGYLLVRTDGGCWPRCQDLAADCDEPGAFCVTLRQGLPLDDAAIAAVSEFTCELIKACIPGCQCKLPARTTKVVQQGITTELLDPMTFLENGRTGIYIVDMWLLAVNPNRLQSQPQVMSPDYRPPRVMGIR